MALDGRVELAWQPVTGATGYVGGEEDVAGGTVYAIFDIGDRYVVYIPGGHEIVTKRQTYAVVEFD